MIELGPYAPDSIVCGNAAELMTKLPADCIDLVVTSPPYDNLRDYNGYTFDFEAIAAQLWRVTKPGGVVVWVVGDATINGSETGTSFRQALHFMELGFNLHDTMIYERPARYPDTNRYYANAEYMFVFSKGAPSSVNLIQDKLNSTSGDIVSGNDRDPDGGLRPKACTGNSIKKLGIRNNIWKYSAGWMLSSKDKFAFDHPAQFPEALARDHIISWSNPGDLVLDPMCGSGTVLKMCIETGRRFLGFDISEEYVKLAQRRVQVARVPLPGLLP